MRVPILANLLDSDLGIMFNDINGLSVGSKSENTHCLCLKISVMSHQNILIFSGISVQSAQNDCARRTATPATIVYALPANPFCESGGAYWVGHWAGIRSTCWCIRLCCLGASAGLWPHCARQHASLELGASCWSTFTLIPDLTPFFLLALE